jgi:outer membrane lipoprotein carrier protein
MTYRASVAALLVLLLASFAAAGAQPADRTALDRFLADLTTWQADFTQTVTDSRDRKVGEGRGRLVVSRPGRFRWEIAPVDGADQGQLLVADGKNLWFLDRDLEQVTVKPVDQALSQSPAMLLSGTGDVREAFEVTSDGRSDGLDWVAVRPRKREGDFERARLGFRGNDLARMELEDRLGQRTSLRFVDAVRNATVDAQVLQFTPPAGVDVIGNQVR